MITSKYSKQEFKNMSKQEFMQEATYADITENNGKIFNVAYLARESTKHADQMKALNIQIQQLEEFIGEHRHFRLASNCKFVEEGKSGLSTEWRETFQLMMGMAKEGKFDILIVDSISRFARNIGDLFSEIETLKESGVGVLILKGHYWTFNMAYTDIVRLAVEGGLAQAESMQTSSRVRSHMHTVARNGQLICGDMFGYRLVKAVDRKDNTFKIEGTEAYTVQTIFERYASDDPKEHLSTSALVAYLCKNNMFTFAGDLRWSPSKINRIICNEKYMGYSLYGKSKVVDTVKKKRVKTKIKPKAEVLDESGNVIEEGNLIKGNWPAIVEPELWWKAYNKLHANSGTIEEQKMKSGLRASNDAIARKSYCGCGYKMTPQYTHRATNEKRAQFRYKCRGQINEEIQKREGIQTQTKCERAAVSEMKMWIQSLYVFQQLFSSGEDAVQKTVRLIEQCKKDGFVESKSDIKREIEEELVKLHRRLKNYINMKADGELSAEEYKEVYGETQSSIEELESKLNRFDAEIAKRKKKILDLEEIEKRLNTYVDLRGYKVSDDMIEMFVERIICRGNDEFLWVINLSEDATGSGAKYRMQSYDPKYEKALNDDKQFNIISRFIIPVEECEEYCKNKVHRRFVPKYWKNILVKIAIC